VRVAVLASGRGSNFDALLRSTRHEKHAGEIVLVVSDRADAPVLDRARREGVATVVLDPGTARGPWTSEGIQSLLESLREHEIEAICLAGFMRILPTEVVRAFPNRILNIHPSLLPSFPGIRPQRQALRAGVRVSGCTVHLVDDGVDTGPIVLQEAVPVLEGDDEESLARRILEAEHRVYPAALAHLAAGRVHVAGRVTRIHDNGA
jgi:phosphoribosylglycinamide formyltransferase-1